MAGSGSSGWVRHGPDSGARSRVQDLVEGDDVPGPRRTSHHGRDRPGAAHEEASRIPPSDRPTARQVPAGPGGGPDPDPEGELHVPAGEKWTRGVSPPSALTTQPSCQVQERICELEVLEESLQKVWEETRVQYEEDLEILVLQRELEQAERWLGSYESSLMADDGVSPEPPSGWSTWTHLLRGEDGTGTASHQDFLDQVSSCVPYRSLCQMFWTS